MFYEIKLLAGIPSPTAEGTYTINECVIDFEDVDGSLLKKYEKDGYYYYYNKRGALKYYFDSIAEINIFSNDDNAELLNLDYINSNNPDYLYWHDDFDGQEINMDNQRNKLLPVPITEVVEALRNDYKKEKNIRTLWALSLLEAMQDMEEIFVVIAVVGVSH